MKPIVSRKNIRFLMNGIKEEMMNIIRKIMMKLLIRRIINFRAMSFISPG
jgi:hypothetical protein